MSEVDAIEFDTHMVEVPALGQSIGEFVEVVWSIVTVPAVLVAGYLKCLGDKSRIGLAIALVLFGVVLLVWPLPMISIYLAVSFVGHIALIILGRLWDEA